MHLHPAEASTQGLLAAFCPLLKDVWRLRVVGERRAGHSGAMDLQRRR